MSRSRDPAVEAYSNFKKARVVATTLDRIMTNPWASDALKLAVAPHRAEAYAIQESLRRAAATYYQDIKSKGKK